MNVKMIVVLEEGVFLHQIWIQAILALFQNVLIIRHGITLRHIVLILILVLMIHALREYALSRLIIVTIITSALMIPAIVVANVKILILVVTMVYFARLIHVNPHLDAFIQIGPVMIIIHARMIRAMKQQVNVIT
jgi:hypothetical protein